MTASTLLATKGATGRTIRSLLFMQQLLERFATSRAGSGAPLLAAEKLRRHHRGRLASIVTEFRRSTTTRRRRRPTQRKIAARRPSEHSLRHWLCVSRALRAKLCGRGRRRGAAAAAGQIGEPRPRSRQLRAAGRRRALAHEVAQNGPAAPKAGLRTGERSAISTYQPAEDIS